MKVENLKKTERLSDTLENARRLGQRGEVNQAVKLLLNQGIRVDSSVPAPYLVLTELLIAAGRYDDALEVLPEMPPEADRELKFELEALCCCALGMDEMARTAADQVSQRPRAKVVLGTLAVRQGDFARAEQLFSTATVEDPFCARAWLSLGMLRWRQGESAEAWQALKRSVLIDPSCGEALRIAQDMAERLGCETEFLELLSSSLSTYPESRQLACHYVQALSCCGFVAEALKGGENFLEQFGVDDQLLPLLLELRDRVGAYDRCTEGGAAAISLCMIVRDEQESIARCLASVKPVVHELVIVDTGSTDYTIEIARVFGARVVKYAWHDDYAAARNVSLDEANGTWILVLDADEVLSPQDYSLLSQAAGIAEEVAWQVMTRNYVHRSTCQGWHPSDGSYQIEEVTEGWYPSSKVRLFKRDSNIRFHGLVHEMVDSVIRNAGCAIRHADFVVHHYGELNVAATLDKKARYYRLGLAKLADKPGDPELLAELAVQAAELGHLEEALDCWDHVLASQPDNREALFNRGGVLLMLKRYQESVDNSIRVVGLQPMLKEAWLNLVMASIGLADLPAAKSGLVRLAVLAPDYPPLWAAGLVIAVLLEDGPSATRYATQLRQHGYDLDEFVVQRAEDLQQAGHQALAKCLYAWLHQL
jgi:glycosyltransferase involved in cell wall biosynthesis